MPADGAWEGDPSSESCEMGGGPVVDYGLSPEEMMRARNTPVQSTNQVTKLDSVYMLVGPRGLVYSKPATTAADCWRNYAADRDKYGDYILGTGANVSYMKRQGWRAKKVTVILEGV